MITETLGHPHTICKKCDRFKEFHAHNICVDCKDYWCSDCDNIKEENINGILPCLHCIKRTKPFSIINMTV